MDNVLVSIICITFNQKRYLEAALDSFLSQEVDFTYEVLVHDDASTDGTTELLREYAEKYPQLIKPVYEVQNRYSQGLSPSRPLYEIAKGKYIALCEGDDFWTDTKKLAKQVNFLEEHSEYSLCTHAAYYANEDGSLRSDRFFRPFKTSRIVSTEEIIGGWLFATNSFLFRNELYEYPIPFMLDAPHGDFGLMTYLSLRGKVYYLDEFMSAYRAISIGSITWNSRKNPEKALHAVSQLNDLLDRIDLYTDFAYHDSINLRKRMNTFNQALSSGDTRTAKAHPELYSSMSTPVKIKLALKGLLIKGKKLLYWTKNK